MAKYLINDTTLQSIADAIRAKKGTSGSITVSDFANQISSIEGGGTTTECTRKHVTELEELPQDGLVEGEVYKVKRKALLGISLYDEDRFYPDYFGLIFHVMGALLGAGIEIPEGFYRYSKEVPTDTPDLEECYCYVESEEMLYGYSPETGWVSVAEAGESDPEMRYIGAITSHDQVTEYGIYAYIGYEGSEFYELTPETFQLIVLFNGIPTDMGMVVPYEFEIVPTLPTENIVDSTDTFFHCYYVEDPRDVLVHNSVDGWVSFSTSSMAAEFGGFINNMEQATDENKVYVLTNNGGIMDYFHPEGRLKVTRSGTYDATKYSSVNVDVPDVAVCGIRKIVLSNLPNTMTVPINFTTTYEGETVKCVGMYVEYDLFDSCYRLNYIREDETSIQVYDGMDSGYLPSPESLWVDFGSEPQLVPRAFGDFISQAIPVFDIVKVDDYQFVVNGVGYQAKPAMNWHEFALDSQHQMEGLYAAYGYVTKDGQQLYCNGAAVDWQDLIIDGAIYTSRVQIAFTVDGVRYYAEQDMTWADWVNDAEYPIGDIYINADSGVAYMCVRNVGYIYYNGAKVIAGDTIISGAAYTTDNTITFTIDSISYKADKGMTWSEWIVSGYNTGSRFTSMEGEVFDTQAGCYVCLPNGDHVAAAAEITNGAEYILPV